MHLSSPYASLARVSSGAALAARSGRKYRVEAAPWRPGAELVMKRVVVVVCVAVCAACAPPPASNVAATPAPAGTVAGVVAETMDSGGYTYARLTGAGGERWMAATAFPIVLGATISATVDMPMRNFESRTLNRQFTEIVFVRDVVMNGTPVAAAASGAAPAMVGSHDGGAAVEPLPTLIAPVALAPGGITIADVWARRAQLADTAVVVRGRIVKANLAIMGANWYHLQDGSGVVSAGTHDLVVTSSAEVAAGDVVTVSGVLATDKDFGAGYSYEAIVERADIKKEPAGR